MVLTCPRLLTRPNCTLSDYLLQVLSPCFHQSPVHATFPEFLWLVNQYHAGIQPPHPSALQSRAWAGMGSCCFVCLPSIPPERQELVWTPAKTANSPRQNVYTCISKFNFPGTTPDQGPHLSSQPLPGAELARKAPRQTLFAWDRKSQQAEGKGVHWNPWSRAALVLCSDHIIHSLSFLLFSHTLCQPHTPFPPLLAGAKATSLGLLPCATSQYFKQHSGGMSYSHFLPAGLLTCIHMCCLAQHTIRNGPESCGCSCQHSLLPLLTALQRLGPPAQPSQMRFIPSSSPRGSLQGSLHCWPILELLSQCWGCWSLSPGRAGSVWCRLQWDKSGRDLKAAFAALFLGCCRTDPKNLPFVCYWASNSLLQTPCWFLTCWIEASLCLPT